MQCSAVRCKSATRSLGTVLKTAAWKETTMVATVSAAGQSRPAASGAKWAAPKWARKKESKLSGGALEERLGGKKGGSALCVWPDGTMKPTSDGGM